MKKLYLSTFLIFFMPLMLLAQSNQARGLSLIREKEIKEEEGYRGKRYAICIGINEYEHNDIQDLNKARNDALALGEVLEREGQFDRVFVMTDDVDPRYDEMQRYPRLRNIRSRLSYLKDFIRTEDMVVITFSGHGISNSDGEGFLIVSDTDYNDVFSTSLPVADLVKWVEDLKVAKSLFMIDACREQVSERTSRSLSSNNLRADRFENSRLGAVFYATKTGWYSYEDRESEYGVFTRFLLEGLRGKADYQMGNSDSIVTFRELSSFVEEAVGNYSMNLGLKQKPFTRILGEMSGDLALSSYSASINVNARSASTPQVQENRNAFGELAVYSNVEGELRIDGESHGEIARGETRIIEDLYVGSHFVEIDHDYGIFRNDAVILEDRENELANVVVRHEQDIRTVNGINFVYVSSRGSMPGFWISDTEISLGQFKQFVDDSGYQTVNPWDKYYREHYDYYPVHSVSQQDALEFSKWFSRKFRTRVTLPTLEQWQHAAGSKFGTSYPWGSFWDSSYCHNKNSDTRGVLPIMGEQGPRQVQFFGKDITIDGVTNLAGNVKEWCLDVSTNSEGNPIGYVAGGSWQSSRSRNFKWENTGRKPTYQTAEDLGFRIVLQ